VAEVNSPDNTFAEVEAKTLDRLAAGTKLVLVIDPARRTATTYRGPQDVHVRTGDTLLDRGDAVPGWRGALLDVPLRPASPRLTGRPRRAPDEVAQLKFLCRYPHRSAGTPAHPMSDG
jgi:hypothetical protein